jgi:hypothetical protein
MIKKFKTVAENEIKRKFRCEFFYKKTGIINFKNRNNNIND